MADTTMYPAHSSFEEEEEEDCTICAHPTGSFNDDGQREFAIKTPCGHVFGSCCLHTWIMIESRYDCPMCRRDLDESTFFFDDERFSRLSNISVPISQDRAGRITCLVLDELKSHIVHDGRKLKIDEGTRWVIIDSLGSSILGISEGPSCDALYDPAHDLFNYLKLPEDHLYFWTSGWLMTDLKHGTQAWAIRSSTIKSGRIKLNGATIPLENKGCYVILDRDLKIVKFVGSLDDWLISDPEMLKLATARRDREIKMMIAEGYFDLQDENREINESLDIIWDENEF